MTVSDLIAELRQYPPHLPVRVLLSEVVMPGENAEPYLQPLTKDDSMEADIVRFEGNHILIESK